jgi:hypothetical protein
VTSDFVTAYPLSWPIGWPRRKPGTAEQSRFGAGGGTTLGHGRDTLLDELERMGATSIVISSNVRLRVDGLPQANAPEPFDHGVAVYFRIKGQPSALACDKWDRAADNLRALAKHVEAIRGQLRWGVGSIEQAFGGYKALAEVGARAPWWQVLGISSDSTWREIEHRRDQLLHQHHPDHGGTHDRAAEINAAFDDARAERDMPR